MKDENMTDVELSAECEAEMSDGKGLRTNEYFCSCDLHAVVSELQQAA